MNGYIKALRLPIVVMAGLLAITAFRVSVWRTEAYLVALFVVIVASSTMIHNDWRDREHDAKKGKDFALKHSGTFGVFVLLFWVCSLILAICLWATNPCYGVISGGIIISGLIYSETRRVPILPASLVALTSASPVFYAGPSDHRVLFLFLTSAFLIFGREVLKDLDDYPHDDGYKWTLPLALGRRLAKIYAGAIVFLVPLLALGISTKTLVGMPFLAISASCLIFDRGHFSAKVLLDIGMAIIIATLIASGP